MSQFNNFIQTELPKRPFTESDGQPGQILARSNDPLKPRELVWQDLPTGGEDSNMFVQETAPTTFDSQTVWIQI